MNEPQIPKKDLIILVADRNMEFAVRGMMERPEALGIRQVTFDIVPFVGKNDPGCFHQSHNLLRLHLNKYDHALVLFDYAGCGQEGSCEGIAQHVRDQLTRTGWRSAQVVVIEPELEMWVWSDSSQVSQCLGWLNQPTDLKSL